MMKLILILATLFTLAACPPDEGPRSPDGGDDCDCRHNGICVLCEEPNVPRDPDTPSGDI